MSEIDQEVITEGDVGEMPDELLDAAGETVEAEDEEQSKEDAIREVFDSGVVEEADEDDIKLQMIGAGATFKNVTRLYNQFMIDAGFALSKEDKAAHVTAALEGRAFEDEDGYDEAVASLMSEDKGINERSAGALLRAYAKKNDLDIYKKPKAEGSGKPGFVQNYYDFLRDNPLATEKEAEAWIRSPANEASENNIKMLSFFQRIRELANAIAGQYVVDPGPEAA